MASFCAKCGAALAPNQQSCSTCGAAADTGGAAAAFVPPIGAPAKSGSSTLKIVLIIVAIIVGLGILGIGALVFVGYSIAKNAHVDSSGRVTINTPAGAITTTPVENLSASDLGVDIYPGAQSTRGSMKMEMPTGSSVTGAFLTSDPPAQVVAFYKDKLGVGASVTSIFGNTIIHRKTGDQEFVQVTITASPSADNGKTRITIQHMNSTKGS
jgi:hypothetical protein